MCRPRCLRFLTGLMIVLTVSTSPLGAQVCMGMASFSAGALRIGGSAVFGDDSKFFGGGLAFGSGGGFAGVGIGSISYDDFAGSTFVINASAGYQLLLRSTSSIGLCPVASFSLGIGPNDIEGSGIDASSSGFTFGFQLGTAIPGGEQFQLIPSAGVAFAHSRFELEDGGGNSLLEDSDTYGIVSVGVGLVFNAVLTILPHVQIPVGLEGADPIYGGSLGLQFGRRRTAEAPQSSRVAF